MRDQFGNEVNSDSVFGVSLGYCGATDCCLVLSKTGEGSKQYGVESNAWRMIDSGLRLQVGESVSPTDSVKWLVLNQIWIDNDSDIFC